jgi:hypothetical protein
VAILHSGYTTQLLYYTVAIPVQTHTYKHTHTHVGALGLYPALFIIDEGQCWRDVSVAGMRGGGKEWNTRPYQAAVLLEEEIRAVYGEEPVQSAGSQRYGSLPLLIPIPDRQTNGAAAAVLNADLQRTARGAERSGAPQRPAGHQSPPLP